MKLREAEVARILNEIVDPCSVAIGIPIGLADMGIIEAVEIDRGHVRVVLIPTFAGCLQLGVFEHEIVSRVTRLDWCTAVSVELDDGEAIWDESRMTDEVRHALRVRRQAIRRTLGLSAQRARSGG